MVLDTVHKYFKMWLWILIGLNLVTKVHGYANGFFPDSCGNMSVEHKNRDGVQYAPQNTEQPFTVNFNYSDMGNNITVTLQGKQSAQFRGFMLEAWTNGTDHPVGNFILLETGNTQILKCRNMQGYAVSQKNNKRKTSIQVKWTADEQNITDINFRVTFLESLSKFWNVMNFYVTLPSPTTPSPTTTTTIDTTVPSTTISTAMSSSTSEPDSSTTSTAGPSSTTQKPKPNGLLGGTGTVVMNFRSVVVVVKMELPNILMTTLVSSLCSHHLSKALKISCCLLSAAIEISALVLFCLAEPIKVTLIALVCVTIVINFVELVIVSLPIGPSHELKEISDLIVTVCSVIHGIFTIAIIFVGVLDNDNCGESRKDSWLVKVMIAFTVWMLLFVIWVFVRRILRKTILGRNKTESLKNNESWRQQRKKKKPSAAKVIFPCVSALFIFGATCFAVAVTVGIFGCQKK